MNKEISILSFALTASIFAAFAAVSYGNSPIASSSFHGSKFLAECAFDGNLETRWASADADNDGWIQIDFGVVTRFDAITINWEAAFAVDYEIFVSNDSANWRSVYRNENSSGGVHNLCGLNAEGRFVRIGCHKPTQYDLYSIYEISFPEEAMAKLMDDIRRRAEEEKRAVAAEARKKICDVLTEAGAGEIVFAARPMYKDGHWYANIAYYAADSKQKTYEKGGALYILSIATGEAKPLLEDSEGTFRDPALNYDGKTILFSWRKGGEESFHLFTIQTDGTGLKQLTSGEYDDIEPSWLPDGGIVFVSSRCRRWVNCWLTQVAVIHRCDADGKNITPLSANLEQDNTPWPMPDGRILYTRWEYVDRSQVDYHHLWTMNPDGTEQSVFFGNMHPSGLFIDAKPVPGSDDVVFINSAGHGLREHTGKVSLVTAKRGPDELSSLRDISGDGYRDPYPITPDLFIAARDKSVVALNANGSEEVLYTLPDGAMIANEPRPAAARELERVIPARTNPALETGRVVVADVYAGRNMKGVERGEIKSLMVLESLPKPINYTGGMDPLTYGGSFSLERILGTAPVEEDGSAFIELPAKRSLFFVALDANGDSIKRMQSFFTVMPGESLSCVGCHESRTTSARVGERAMLKALSRPVSKLTPIEGLPEVFDFPRDIQPILDAHCLKCHDYDAHDGCGPRAGGVILSGDHGPVLSHSYAELTVLRQFADGRDQPKSNLAPRTIGSGASPLMKKIRGGHHNDALSAREISIIRGWIETGATYPGTYAALGAGSIGGFYSNLSTENDQEWPESKAATAVVERRCASCHANEHSLPKFLADENGLSFWRPEWNDPRLMRTRHLLFNVSHPEKSLMLLAPLSKDAGGYGLCRADGGDGNGKPVFVDASDPDYQAVLTMLVAGKNRLDVIKRFDMPGYLPPQPYFREMKRYGVLPLETPEDRPIDFYETDRVYWRSFELPIAYEHPAYKLSKAED